jgi:SsrA-binding protein
MSADIVTNRKALRDYHVLERIEAGIELRGTEVKSIRGGFVQLQGAFARADGSQIFLHDCDIRPYAKAGHEQHEPRRPRRLLLHRHEIDRLVGETEAAGKTLVVLRMYWKMGRVKVELGLGKGKAAVDKRADLKKRVQQRETERLLAALARRK